MRKIIIGQPLLPSLSMEVKCIALTNIVVSNEPRIKSIGRLTDKITCEAWEAINIVLSDCPKDSEHHWIQRSPIQAIKLVRDLSGIGGGNLRLKESKSPVDKARAGVWISHLETVTIEVY